MMITLKIPNEQLFDKILWLLNRFKNDGLEIITSNTEQNEATPKSTKNHVDLSNFSGMWEDREITQESIRKKAWK
ncbi:MAG: Unknown protein [uncultured Sulfurovum sp.]|uniref:Uncharacterized protein n=1 Tax=uncultured Sulfurovum sp. TaxID=269237 RepID=A0A6S6SAQ9_9BACT|nr:MAG: Unknown protein [uncultured Sulfurovum sp.]